MSVNLKSNVTSHKFLFFKWNTRTPWTTGDTICDLCGKVWVNDYYCGICTGWNQSVFTSKIEYGIAKKYLDVCRTHKDKEVLKLIKKLT
jgi:hypothetical protein